MSATIIAIGASIGGPEALKLILSELPRACPPVVITQHMPPSYVHLLVRGLDQASALDVRVAEDGMPLESGQAVVAPGDAHLRIGSDGADGGYRVALGRSAPINRHRPSIDALFVSVARVAGAGAIGVLLTGMGNDGAAGLLLLRQTGALTLLQDEASCVVYGMPGRANELGAGRETVPLAQMAKRIAVAVSESHSAADAQPRRASHVALAR